ncbi:MAG: hypothetical protein AAF623_11690, partial [Planctomycetota bacterium]
SKLEYAATMTGHNNQTLHAISGRLRKLVVGAQPFYRTTSKIGIENIADLKQFDVDSDSDPFATDDEFDEDLEINLLTKTRRIVGFEPIFQSFHEGTTVQATPLATRGGNFVIVDFHAKINRLVKDENEQKEGPSIFAESDDHSKSEVVLDTSDFDFLRLDTTLRCPQNQVVLAGQMYFRPPNDETEHRNLFIFVKASIHTIEEDESDWIQESSQTNTNHRSMPSKAN